MTDYFNLSKCVCGHTHLQHWKYADKKQAKDCSKCDCPQFALAPKMNLLDCSLKSAKVLALLCACVVIIALGYAGVQALDAVTSAANEHRELAADGRAALSGIVQELDATLQRVSVAADQFAEASKEQRVQALETTKQVTLLVKDVRSVVYLVENETLPALNSAITNQNQKLAAVMEESARLLYDTNKRLEPILTDTASMTKQGTESMAKLNATMDEAHETMVQGKETMTNVNAMSKDAREAMHRATRPAKLVVTGAKFLWDQFLKIATAFK